MKISVSSLTKAKLFELPLLSNKIEWEIFYNVLITKITYKIWTRRFISKEFEKT